MTDSGVNEKVAERMLKNFPKFKTAWFECIDSSFIHEEQKQQLKSLITRRLETLQK